VIASELPSRGGGRLLTRAEPGWYALKDRPALSSADIVRPAAETGELGEPTVTFGFTRKGRAAFERLTLAVAQRGRALAGSRVSEAEAESLSHHFAVVYDSEVKTKPIINFQQFPHGIDGRTGAQISGGFVDLAEARDLAAVLSVDPLPLELSLTRLKRLGAS
jgi:SecD/SecF fusion protein